MPAQMPFVMPSRLLLRQSTLERNQDQFADDVRIGLTAKPKTLPPKYFYDALGSQLFEAICLLPEYYLTRAETEIFERDAGEIISHLRGPVSLVELGSGSSVKSRLLIEAILAQQTQLHYQPIDISATILEQSAEKLLSDYPNLHVTAQISDYTQGLDSIARADGERILVLFLGSNIGNYPPHEAQSLLRQIRGALRAGDGLLLGADLKKSSSILVPAYDDALGVTAAFNLNLLVRINRELASDFDLARFQHRAIYNEEMGRIEMHLVSRTAQTVSINQIGQTGLKIAFEEGETIHTESSHKYSLNQLATLAQTTGFTPARTWFDAKKQFSCNLWLAKRFDD